MTVHKYALIMLIIFTVGLTTMVLQATGCYSFDTANRMFSIVSIAWILTGVPLFWTLYREDMK